MHILFFFSWNFHAVFGEQIAIFYQTFKSGSSKNFFNLQRWPMGPFKSFVMNNKAFRNSFCNPQKSFHTYLHDSNNRGCQSFFKLNNSIYKKFYI